MKKKLFAISVISAFSALTTAVASFAWFSLKEFDNNKFKDIDGSAASAYFAYGSGTSSDPYGIKTPRQLYNLAWLQYNGTFNKDANSDGTIDKQYYFVLDSSLQSTGLDMTGWVLPPIGTEDYPFLGNFNGNNVSINNLTVSNKADLEKPQGIAYTKQPEIVGFFGVVGDLDLDITYTSSINTMYNFTLKNVTVESKTSETLIGLAAGYVDATMSNVKLDGSATLDVNGQVSTAKTDITSKLSDYGLVGYTTKSGNRGSYSQDLSAYYSNNESGQGHGQDWGGSINMHNLYGRLKSVYNEYSYDSGNFTVTTITDENGNTTRQKTENLSNHFAGIHDNDYSYTLNKHSSGSQDFYYLYGDYSPVSGNKTDNAYVKAKKNVSGTKYYIVQSSQGYVIKAGTHFVKMPQMTARNNTTVVQVVDNQSDATYFKRAANGNGYRYYVAQTVSGSTSNFYIGTLSGSSQKDLVVIGYNPDTTANKKYTTWYTDGTGTYHYRKNSSDTTTKFYMCYSGSKFVSNPSSVTGTAANCETISSSFYLKGDTSGICSPVPNSANATQWFYQNNKLFTCIDNEIYHLQFTGSTLKLNHLLTEANALTWSFSGGAFSFVYSGTTYYLDLAQASLVSTSQNTSTSMTSAGNASLSDQVYVSSSSTTVTSNPASFLNTYLPLNVSNSNIFNTLQSNTGYIISGKASASGTEADRYNSGDIRVSRYDMSNISTSLGQSTFDNSKLFVITATGNSDYALVTDTNNTGKTPSSGLSSITSRKDASTLNRYYDWEEHTGARTALGNTFTNDSENIYGLHFMDASISSSNLVTVPNAVINKKTYTSGLQMPKDSIDFFVKESGYISFFAGTYFGVGWDSENTCFFSLHKIERDSSDNITSITEIRTIYKDNTNRYYYNPSTTTGLTKVFDTAVLTAPTTFINNAVYYFEIPVMEGEYALGSVSGENGAYLMYLDISASGEQVLNDSVSAYWITTNKTGNDFPLGVDFKVKNVGNGGGDSIGVFVDSGSKGTIVFTLSSTGNLITVSSLEGTTQVGGYAFRGAGYSVDFNVDGMSGAPPGDTGGKTKVLTIDVTLASDESDYTVLIVDTLGDGDAVTGTSYYLGSGSSMPTVSTLATIQSTIASLSNELIANFRALDKVVTLTRSSGNGEFETKYDVENCYYSDQIIDVDVELNGSRATVGAITSGYQFLVGGVAKSEGNILS